MMNNWFSIELHEEGFEYTKEYIFVDAIRIRYGKAAI
jgi:hypothetical protein